MPNIPDLILKKVMNKGCLFKKQPDLWGFSVRTAVCLSSCLPVDLSISLSLYLSISLSLSLSLSLFLSLSLSRSHFGSSPKLFWLGCGRVTQAHSFLWAPGGYGI